MACIARRRNRWVVDFRDQQGVRRWESYGTRDEAKAALERRLGQVRKSTYTAPAQLPTLAEVADGWLASKADRRPSTRATWENHVHVHIVPRLGTLRIDQVQVRDVEERLRNELRGKLVPRTVNAILTTLTSVFDYAARCGYVERNVAELAERLRANTAEQSDTAPAGREVDPKDVPSPAEIKRLLAAAEPGWHHTYILTAAVTGARSGELLALTWPDVDLDSGTIAIRRAATWARTRADREAGQSGARYFAPKTKHSHRQVEAPPELVSALRRWKLACPSSSGGLVFPKADGTAMHRKTLADQALHPAQQRAGLRRFGVHQLRHFFASELIRQGYPPTEVAARLGHSSPVVTLQVYARWYSTAKSDAVTSLAKMLCAEA